MTPTPIDKISLDGRNFYVKRDDLIDPFLAGNKFRKLYKLLKTPKDKYNTIISYGGTQSNAMLAIAAMCKSKDWQFIYYTKPISKMQIELDEGNFSKALSLGMKHVEIENDNYKDYISSIRVSHDDKCYIIDQGGAVLEAKEGLQVLADEIKEQMPDINSLATPSGTGTTALFLALALPTCKIYTTPCIGDIEYLKEQMNALHQIPNNLIILEPDRKYHFAKPYKEFLDIYAKLLTSSIEFDLLYAPGMWKALIEQTDEEVLYIHSGGVSGNKSMLKRYAKKGMIP